MTSIEHLHCETQILPVKERNGMFSKQCLLAAISNKRWDHHTTKHNLMSRLIKPTFAKKYYGNITKHLDENDRLTPDQYKVALKTILSNEVKNYVTKHPS